MNINPFEWHGPAFLLFYMMSMAVAAVVAYRVKQIYLGKTETLVTSANEASAIARKLTAYEAAYLEGGAERVLYVLCATLARHDIIAIDRKERLLVKGPKFECYAGHLNSLEKELLDAMLLSMDSAKRLIYSECKSIKIELEKMELSPTEVEIGRARLLPFITVLVAATVLAVPKMIIEASLNKPIALLLFELFIGVVIAFSFLAGKCLTTNKGDAVRKALNKGGDALKLIFLRCPQQLSLSDTAFAYALLGTTVLEMDPFFLSTRLALKPPAASGCGC